MHEVNLVIQVVPSRASQIRALMKAAQINDESEFILEMIEMMEMLFEGCEEGFELAFLDQSSHSYAEIVAPCLDHSRKMAGYENVRAGSPPTASPEVAESDDTAGETNQDAEFDLLHMEAVNGDLRLTEFPVTISDALWNEYLPVLMEEAGTATHQDFLNQALTLASVFAAEHARAEEHRRQLVFIDPRTREVIQVPYAGTVPWLKELTEVVAV